MPQQLQHGDIHHQPMPLYAAAVPAGFPSPADDYIETALDLNAHLIRHPTATFFLRMKGDAMREEIKDGDILVVDRSLAPAHGKIVVAAFDGRLVVRRLCKRRGTIHLLAENGDFRPITLHEGNDTEIWGVVTTVLHAV